jgi:6-phosphogluconolactonase
MELHTCRDLDALNHAITEWITGVIENSLKTQDRFTIALSGGGSPIPVHRLLASSPFKERIDWSKLHVFWGDERAVPFEDDRNNAKMGFDTLLNFVPVPPAQIHIMRTDIPPDQSAAEYEKLLHEYFSNTGPSFDLVLLGMGDDGHTLSLFPGMPVVHEEKAWATSFFLKAQDMYRITLTRPIVCRSKRIAFLTAGIKKAHALKEVLKGKYDPDKYPSQTIMPQAGELHWFVDEAAAAELK